MSGKNEARDRLIAQARAAIEAERPEEARVALESAIRLGDNDPRPWLLLAGIAPNIRARKAYLAQADRVKASAVPVSEPRAAAVVPARRTSNNRRAAVVLVFLALMIAAGLAFARQPQARALLAELVRQTNSATGTLAQRQEAATMGMAVASTDLTLRGVDLFATDAAGEAAPVATSEPPLLPTATTAPELAAKPIAQGGLLLPTWTPTPFPTPTLAPTVTPSPTPVPSPTPEPVVVEPAPAAPPIAVAPGQRWIDVDLTNQTLVAYEGDTPVYSTLVSSGTWQFPTVVGQFHTYMKYESQTMNGYLLGYDYYLENVPYVMYFYEDYAIHGTYWHSNFGTPMSHGCVNVSTPDAGWLFEWAPVGTLVNVRY